MSEVGARAPRRARHVLAWFAMAMVALALAVAAPPAHADALRVATASNFADPMARLAAAFEAASGHRVTPIAGSTGKHYAQILQGAPFDAFFAADAERPGRLEQEGAIVPGTRFTYAVGVLALYSREPARIDDGAALLAGGDFARLAVANPRLAPYGRAALETLESLGVLDAVRGRLVYGENVAQAMAFVSSGNAEVGFVAFSQLLGPEGAARGGSHWVVPAELHAPIEQQAALLRDTPAGRDFIDFVRGEAGRAIIASRGYGVP